MKRSVVQCHAVTLVTEEVWRPLWDTIRQSERHQLQFDYFKPYVWQLWWLRRVFGSKRCWPITEQSWLSFKCHVTLSRQWPCTSCPSHSFGVRITCNLQHRLVVWTLELWEQTDPLPLCSRLYLYLHDRNHNTWIGCKFSVKEIDKPYDKNGKVYYYCMKQLGILHICEKEKKPK